MSISSSGWTKNTKKHLTNLNYQLLVGRSGEVVWRWVSNPRRGWGLSISTGNLSKQSKETQPTQWTYHVHPQNRSSGVPVASIFANLLKGKLFALVLAVSELPGSNPAGFNKIFPETKISPWKGSFWRWLSVFPTWDMLVPSLEGNFTNRNLCKDVPISREVSKIQFGDVRPVGPGACYQ